MERDVRNRLTSHHLVIAKLNWYAQRRKIETYHKIFKSGRRAERNRLRGERNREMHEVGYASLALEPYGLCYCFVPFTTPDESPVSEFDGLYGSVRNPFPAMVTVLLPGSKHAPIAGS